MIISMDFEIVIFNKNQNKIILSLQRKFKALKQFYKILKKLKQKKANTYQ